MSSTVIITAGASVLLPEPVGFGLIMGAAAVAFVASRYDTRDSHTTRIASSANSLEAEKRRREEAAHAISEAWQRTKQKLSAEASGITSTYERKKLITAINDSESRYRKAVADGDTLSAAQVVSSIRERIFTVHAEEAMLRDRQQKFLGLLNDMKANALPQKV